MIHRSRRLRAGVLVVVCSGLGLAAVPSEAATRKFARHGRQAVKAPVAKTVVEESKATDPSPERVEPTGVWTSGEQDRACFRGRRKLWQDGQGWVVKRVSVCP